MNKYFSPLIISFIFFLIGNFVFDYLFYSNIGIALTIFILIDFIQKLGTEIPIKQLILLLASSQWIVGARLSYSFGKVHHKYFMYVDEETYMSYVVPGFIAFMIGIYFISSDLKIGSLRALFENDKKNKKLTAYSLIFIGLTSLIISRNFSIPSLYFILYLLSLLLYIGISYLFFIFPKYKYHLFLITICFAFILALKSGMFHQLLLTTTFLSFFIVPKRLKTIGKSVLVLVGFFAIYSIQIIKQDFRAIIWTGQNSNYIEVFFNLAEQKIDDSNNEQKIGDSNKHENNKKTNKENANTNNRLNQGWIISRVLYQIPSKKDYLYGKTVIEAIESSLIPRFLSPNKGGGNQSVANFKNVTGLSLGKGTTMGLSLIAEFYANFGIMGGWLSMFIYGLFLALMIRLIVVMLGNNSSIITLWIILFFFQIIKAETDLMKVLNYAVKSIVLFIILKYIFSTTNIPLFKASEKKVQ